MKTYARFITTTATHVTQNTKPNALRFQGNTSVRLPFFVFKSCDLQNPSYVTQNPGYSTGVEGSPLGGLINPDYETLWRVLPALIHKISLFSSGVKPR